VRQSVFGETCDTCDCATIVDGLISEVEKCFKWDTLRLSVLRTCLLAKRRKSILRDLLYLCFFSKRDISRNDKKRFLFLIMCIDFKSQLEKKSLSTILKRIFK